MDQISIQIIEQNSQLTSQIIELQTQTVQTHLIWICALTLIVFIVILCCTIRKIKRRSFREENGQNATPIPNLKSTEEKIRKYNENLKKKMVEGKLEHSQILKGLGIESQALNLNVSFSIN